MGTIFWARSISSGSTFDNPTWRIFPASFIFPDGAERFFQGHLGIDTMQLIHVDLLEAQSLQTAIDSLLEMLGAFHPAPSRRGPVELSRLWSR